MNDKTKLIIGVISLLIPSVLTILTWLFTKPNEEEARIGRLRKNLLEYFRFKISIEVASIMPHKTGTVDDSYIGLCSDKLKEYFSSNSLVLIDFINSEKTFNTYLTGLRYFKYALISIFLLGLALAIIFYLISASDTYYIISTLILVLLIALFWFLMEKKKDCYHDLCNKYEITDDSKNKKK